MHVRDHCECAQKLSAVKQALIAVCLKSAVVTSLPDSAACRIHSTAMLHHTSILVKISGRTIQTLLLQELYIPGLNKLWLFVILRYLYHSREHTILFEIMQKLSNAVYWSCYDKTLQVTTNSESH